MWIRGKSNEALNKNDHSWFLRIFSSQIFTYLFPTSHQIKRPPVFYFSDWQPACVNSRQYRNILSMKPSFCTLTKAQEESRMRECGSSSVTDAIKEGASKITSGISGALKAFMQKIVLMVSEATEYTKNNTGTILARLGIIRQPQKEKITVEKYLAIITPDIKGITDSMRSTLTHFIAYGTPTTRWIGEGERAGVLNSYKTAFSKLSKTTNEWSDAIKIANGRWPQERNEKMETHAKAIFKKIYLREPNLKNPHNDAAVKIIAYGLLPADRNMNSEKSAIATFKNIYAKSPDSAQSWNTVRAIAYSGAKR